MEKRANFDIENSKQRRKKLANEQINLIRHEVRNYKNEKIKNLNATQIQQKLELPVTTWHLTSALVSILYVKCKTPKCKLLLKRQHRNDKLEFAKAHI